MYIINERTDRPQGAKSGDLYIRGNIIPQRFSAEELPSDGPHERVRLTAPNGETLIHTAWCGRHPCKSNWAETREWMARWPG